MTFIELRARYYSNGAAHCARRARDSEDTMIVIEINLATLAGLWSIACQSRVFFPIVVNHGHVHQLHADFLFPRDNSSEFPETDYS